jgi:selenocysteine-specific elongation factor
MFIIGTAGHIDHGKSSLVQALTGMNPDRLPEEKRRGMTIDLGFAYLSLLAGQVIGMVDVPGHRDLMRNVLAGAWGIDAALLVVAADDGWMPQTEEHLQVLQLLHIRHGIVVITKVDLIDDPEWLDVIEEDIRAKLEGTLLTNAPVLRVSAKDGSNIEELKRSIANLISEIAFKKDAGKPRLPIDRVFTISGSGTVVTGTLVDGSLSQGQKVVIHPQNLHVRIRALESYNERVDRVQPGTRVALNLVGVEKEALTRGDVLYGEEAQIKSSRILDARVELVPRLIFPIKSNEELMVYLGTREIRGRMMLLEKKVLGPGDSAIAQFQFAEEVTARIGDRFIIRRPSPATTIGGGTVLDPLADRHRSKEMGRVIQFLQRRESFEIGDLILSELEKNTYVRSEDLLIASPFSTSEVFDSIGLLQKEEKLLAIGPWLMDSRSWARQADEVLHALSKRHSLYPLEKGLPQAELQNYLGLPKEIFDKLIVALINSEKIARNENTIALATHKPQLSPEEESIASEILELFGKDRNNPPTRREVEIQKPGSGHIVRFMCQEGMLIELPEDVLFEKKHYETVTGEIIEYLKSHNAISIQQVRNLLGFSRKYILPLLTRLDQEGITQRHGDDRVLVERGNDQHGKGRISTLINGERLS